MLFDFFNLVFELKKTPRMGWKKKVGIEKPESVADHTFGTAMMSMIFSDSMKFDTEKILKMALLHDLAESITGDFMPSEISKEHKKIIENEAIDEIFSRLPSNIAESYKSIWNEFQDEKTKESSLLHEIDRLEMSFQASKYIAEGYSKEKLEEFFLYSKEKIKSKELLDVLDSLSYK